MVNKKYCTGCKSELNPALKKSVMIKNEKVDSIQCSNCGVVVLKNCLCKWCQISTFYEGVKK